MAIQGIKIYETNYAGSVKRIWALKPSGEWQSLWSGSVQSLGYSRIFSPFVLVISNYDLLNKIVE